MQKKQPSQSGRRLSPEAAKVLEQYRNAGKPVATGDGSVETDSGTGSTPKPAGPPPAAQMRRSGTRGK